MSLLDNLQNAVEAEQIPFRERCEASHIQFLTEFEKKVWPALKGFGYFKDTLLLYWILVAIQNDTTAIYHRLLKEDESL
jgi:hypothetical protein